MVIEFILSIITPLIRGFLILLDFLVFPAHLLNLLVWFLNFIKNYTGLLFIFIRHQTFTTILISYLTFNISYFVFFKQKLLLQLFYYVSKFLKEVIFSITKFFKK